MGRSQHDFATDPLATTRVRPLGPTPAAVARWRLVCVAGGDLGRVVELDDGVVVLGRGAADVALASGDVSRAHARIAGDDGAFVIEDLGSANGTLVNGRRIDAPLALRPGDRVQLGDTMFVFAQHDELELRLERLQRLEAMGSLAGGIAHDFNNVLTAIMTNLDAIEVALPATAADAHDAIKEIWRATSSATALAQRLQRIAKPEPAGFERVDIAELVEGAVRQLRRQASAEPAGALDVVVDVEQGLAVQGSHDALQQAALNLLTNAREAMPAGGRIEVRARGVALSTDAAFAEELPAAGDYVELAITDHGAGMDAATLARSLEPFFTTKRRGKGNGLGLPMAHGTARAHGGALALRSTLGVGTTARLWLHRQR